MKKITISYAAYKVLAKKAKKERTKIFKIIDRLVIPKKTNKKVFLKKDNTKYNGSQSAHRILKLISYLISKKGIDFETIKKKLGISDRTAYRYLQQITNEGYRIYRDIDSGTYFIERTEKEEPE